MSCATSSVRSAATVARKPSTSTSASTQRACAACAAALGGAVIVHQHNPVQPVLLTTVQRLLAARLGQSAAASDPLTQMREGMQALAERDAELQLAGLLQTLVA